MIEKQPGTTPGSRMIDTKARRSLPREGNNSTGLIDDLEELRDCVLRRLDSIEGLARRRAVTPAVETSRLEQSLRQRVEELESERGRLRAALERDESSVSQMLKQLESERQLLEEAWERLERERIDAISSHHSLAAD